MQAVMQSMRRILRPDFEPYPNGYRGERVYPTLADYIEVPRLHLQGRWRLQDTLSDQSMLNMVIAYNRSGTVAPRPSVKSKLRTR